MTQNDMELEDLKLQFQLLQKKLDKQTEISDNQLKRAFRSNIDGIRRKDIQSMVLCVFAFIFVTGVCYAEGYPVWFQIITALGMGVCMVGSYLVRYKGNRNGALSKESLLDTYQHLQRYKKDTINWMKYGIPTAIVWGILYTYCSLQTMGITDTTHMLAFSLVLFTGGVIGGCIGYFGFTRPAMKHTNEALQQIQEFRCER